MKRWPQLVLLLLLLGAWAGARAGEVIDRIVVVVNDEVILESDLDVAVRYEALLNGKALDQVTAQDRRDALSRLVDQTLILQQMRQAEIQPPTPEEVAAEVEKVRGQLLAGASDQGWAATLQRYGLTQDEFAYRAGIQFRITRFIDMRFRPMVRVDRATIEQYYKDKFLPEMRAKGSQPAPPLREVESMIESVLVEQQIDQLLVAWLATLRNQGDIRLHPSVHEPGRQGVAVP
jgi:peptidyl-prolyl cis-trans isomerase SurA